MSTPDFARMVPGFDFLQGLMKGASAPGMSQWIAPTLDAEEVDKRIQELRTVQFWLEQNARMLGASIQALEVQRMTLATLRTMNVPMSELRESMKLDPAAFTPPPAPAAAPAFAPVQGAAAPAATAATGATAATAAAPAAVDPLQWWGALTRQFTELAASALPDPVATAAAAAASPGRRAASPAAGKAAARPRKTRAGKAAG
ncbi:MAG: hypothetical protein IT501_10220 [Rubrivivax sp.]|nr:hypothetical protein [Rubrivivax sp.]